MKLVDMREMFDEYKRGFNDPQRTVNTHYFEFKVFILFDFYYFLYILK